MTKAIHRAFSLKNSIRALGIPTVNNLGLYYSPIAGVGVTPLWGKRWKSAPALKEMPALPKTSLSNRRPGYDAG